MNKTQLERQTYDDLVKEFGTPMIPLESMCKKFFGLEPETARTRAASGTLPVQPIRLNGQKSPWLMPAAALAKHLVTQLIEAA